ncbi:YraN family protein [Nitriliruptoraceae bacterium ZYF776]|nr:YraN family protein [Profundirhabdus halotolerans]
MDTTTHRCDLDPRLVSRTDLPPGPLGEHLAAAHLVDDGLVVLARNWRLSSGELRGELDVIAVDEPHGTVVVTEVKARRDAERFGGALAAVPPRKAAKVRALTAAFLREARLPYPRVRLDVVAVDLGRRPVLHHVQGAL